MFNTDFKDLNTRLISGKPYWLLGRAATPEEPETAADEAATLV